VVWVEGPGELICFSAEQKQLTNTTDLIPIGSNYTILGVQAATSGVDVYYCSK
jgi:hypothetical protein